MAGRGAGCAMLAALIERCTLAGFKQMVVVIGG
jgi:L-amino acid N-acyltransferase YncA